MQVLAGAFSPLGVAHCAGEQDQGRALPVPFNVLAQLQPPPEAVALSATQDLVKRATALWRVPFHHSFSLIRSLFAGCMGNSSFVLIDPDTQFTQPLCVAEVIMAPSGGGKSGALTGALQGLELGLRRARRSWRDVSQLPDLPAKELLIEGVSGSCWEDCAGSGKAFGQCSPVRSLSLL